MFNHRLDLKTFSATDIIAKLQSYEKASRGMVGANSKTKICEGQSILMVERQNGKIVKLGYREGNNQTIYTDKDKDGKFDLCKSSLFYGRDKDMKEKTKTVDLHTNKVIKAYDGNLFDTKSNPDREVLNSY